MLLDEPTTFLDIAYQLEVLDLLQTLNGQGQTIVMVLHDLNLASQAADRIVLLVHGQVQADGMPGEVLTPDIIERAFGTRVQVLDHPESGVPVIVPLSEESVA